MRKRLITGALFGALAAYACPALADNIQMIPPTPIGSMIACPSGTQQILTYSGAPSESGQGGMNCVPIAADAAGDLSAAGYLQAGNTNVVCTPATIGAIRYNTATMAFEGCNGSNWQSLGGGMTLVVGGCQSGWSACPAGFTATSYFSPGTYNCCDKCGSPAWLYTVCSQ